MEEDDVDNHIEDDLLSVKDISNLLEIEYQKCIEKHVQRKFFSYQSKKTSDLIYVLPIFDEVPNQPPRDGTFDGQVSEQHQEISSKYESCYLDKKMMIIRKISLVRIGYLLIAYVMKHLRSQVKILLEVYPSFLCSRIHFLKVISYGLKYINIIINIVGLIGGHRLG